MLGCDVRRGYIQFFRPAPTDRYAISQMSISCILTQLYVQRSQLSAGVVLVVSRWCNNYAVDQDIR